MLSGDRALLVAYQYIKNFVRINAIVRRIARRDDETVFIGDNQADKVTGISFLCLRADVRIDCCLKCQGAFGTLLSEKSLKRCLGAYQCQA